MLIILNLGLDKDMWRVSYPGRFTSGQYLPVSIEYIRWIVGPQSRSGSFGGEKSLLLWSELLLYC